MGVWEDICEIGEIYACGCHMK